MPHLLPDWQTFIRPAGRLIWSLLLTGVGLAFVVALLLPPRPKKIVTKGPALAGALGVLVIGIVAARIISPLQVLIVWLTMAGVVAVALAGVVSRDPREPGTPVTWAEAMLGSVAVFALFALAYGVVPHEWLTFANSYLNMASDRYIAHPLDRLIKLPYSAIRDSIAAGIYIVFFGANLALWGMWQRRLTPKPEAAATDAPEPAGTSRFGRPLSKRGG